MPPPPPPPKKNNVGKTTIDLIQILNNKHCVWGEGEFREKQIFKVIASWYCCVFTQKSIMNCIYNTTNSSNSSACKNYIQKALLYRYKE